MRKTLRALFLGSALTIAGTGVAQTKFIPMDNTPHPPSQEQQEIYDLLKQYMEMGGILAEPQIRTLEQLEDDFYLGVMPEAEYRTARTEILNRMYPELAATHEEFGSHTNKIVGCSADGLTMAVPVITFVNRGDMTALFNRMVGNSSTPGSSVNYILAVTDLSNRLRQGIENAGRSVVNPFNALALGSAAHDKLVLNHLNEMGQVAARDAEVQVEFRILPPHEIDRACETDAQREKRLEAEKEAAAKAAAAEPAAKESAPKPAPPPVFDPGP